MGRPASRGGMGGPFAHRDGCHGEGAAPVAHRRSDELQVGRQDATAGAILGAQPRGAPQGQSALSAPAPAPDAAAAGSAGLAKTPPLAPPAKTPPLAPPAKKRPLAPPAKKRPPAPPATAAGASAARARVPDDSSEETYPFPWREGDTPVDPNLVDTDDELDQELPWREGNTPIDPNLADERDGCGSGPRRAGCGSGEEAASWEAKMPSRVHGSAFSSAGGGAPGRALGAADAAALTTTGAARATPPHRGPTAGRGRRVRHRCRPAAERAGTPRVHSRQVHPHRRLRMRAGGACENTRAFSSSFWNLEFRNQS